MYTEVETSDSNDGNDSGGHLLFFTKPEAGSLTEGMRIDSSGKIGIGASNPSSYDVGGNNLVIYENGNAGLTISTGTGNTGSIHFADGISGNAAYRGIISYTHHASDSTLESMQFKVVGANSGTQLKLDQNSRISLSNNGGTETTVFGYQALNSGIGGSNVRYSVAIGHRALMSEDSTDGVTAIGYQALISQNQTGNTGNTGIGYQSIYNNVTGTNNTAVGWKSLKGTGSQSSSNITAIGSESLTVAYGQGNTALGQRSGVALTSGVRNVLIGVDAGATATGSSNMVLIGTFAGDAIDNTLADGTVAIGRDSLTALTSGIGNVAMGFESLKTEDTGDGNTAVGYKALKFCNGEDDNGNTAIGYLTLPDLSSGKKNVAIGFKAGVTFNGDNSTIIGYEAGLDATGGAGNSTLIGQEAGKHLNGGTYNTAIGIEAMKSTGSGNTALGNTCIGWRAGDFLKTGTYNVVIGHGAEVSATNATNQIAIGREAVGQADNSVTLGNGDVTDVYMAQDSGATVHADYVLSQGNQNHVANTMSSPYYRFDGVDDKITVSDNALMDDIFDNGGSITAWLYIVSDGEGDEARIVDKRGSGTGWTFHVQGDTGSNVNLKLYVEHSTTAGAWTSPVSVPTNKWVHIAVAYNNSSVSNNPSMYVNGVSVTVTEGTTPVGTRVSDDGEDLTIGNTSGGDRTFDGQMTCIQLHNHELDSTEVKELYSGASVPFKYKGANQTDLVEAHDAGSGTAWTGATGTTPPDGWSAQGSNRTYTIDSGSGSGSEPALKIGSGAAGNAGIIWGGTASLGKRYRATFSYKNDASTVVRTVTNEGTTTLADSTSWTHNQTIEWTGDGASGDFAFTVVTANKNAYIDNFVIQQIGAVAEYDGSSAGEKVWGDKSGNSLDGTVSGATVENAPYDASTEYEEGTFDVGTAGDASGSFSAQTGEYVRIGNMVHVRICVTVSANFTSANFSGLPYTCNNSASPSSLIGGFGVMTGSGGANESITASPSATSTNIILFDGNNAGNSHTPTTAHGTYRMFLSYMT